MFPVLEQTAQLYNASELVVLKVDVDKFRKLSKRYDVPSVPTFILFRKTETIDTIVGAKTEELNESIRWNINHVDDSEVDDDDEDVDSNTENSNDSQNSSEDDSKVDGVRLESSTIHSDMDDGDVDSSNQNSNNSQSSHYSKNSTLLNVTIFLVILSMIVAD
ncbi:thioredoxin-T-like [Sitodiplosis mosellana]|uniref:thioredoxin-T-like n=1 Tax=Sitodiplosis mosellana TaxID=263140 RepID=UPI002443BFC9|nr:thioredoxin-T-like [Sitodiplosis mosellana]